MRILAGLGILLALDPDLSAAEPQRVPGTDVSLEPPKGFSPEKRFPGFSREEIGASIMITEIPGPVAEVKKGMTRQQLLTKGMELISSTTETVSGRESMLLKARQSAEGIVFLKWMVVLGNEKATVMIMGTFPEDSEGEVGDAIRRSILKASWKPEARNKDPFEGLPFRITATRKLKIAGRMGSNLMLTESGTMGPHGPEEPLYVIGPSIRDLEIKDLQSFSETRLKQRTDVKDVRDIESRLLRVGGMEACELLADATDTKTQTVLRIYQVIALGRSNRKAYYIAAGSATKEKAAAFLPEFRRMSESIREVDAKKEARVPEKEQRKPLK